MSQPIRHSQRSRSWVANLTAFLRRVRSVRAQRPRHARRFAEGQPLLTDRAHDSDELRQRLRERGAFANIKPMPNRTNVPTFSPFLYRYRNLVERFFNKFRHYCTVATRYAQ